MMEATDTQLSQLADVIVARLGLHFPPARWNDLRRGIDAATRELGYSDGALLLKQVTSPEISRREVDVLAGCLTVGETYFYREPQVLDALSRQILPDLIQTRTKSGSRRLRIWSAGCCTGEEPYTIAMILDRLISDQRHWDITILATDINPRFIEKARSGIYRRWSFRSCPSWITDTYCQPTRDGGLSIRRRIRDRVEFAYLNLVQDPYPSLSNNTNACDIILCRNVMMYFDADVTARVKRGFYRSLVEGGWFMPSVTEIPAQSAEPFVPQKMDGITFLRKNSDALRTLATKQAVSTTLYAFPPRVAATRQRMLAVRPVPRKVSPARFAPTALAIRPNPKARASALAEVYAAATALYDDGRYDAVIPVLTPLLTGVGNPVSEDSCYAEAMAMLARAHANLGQLEEAREWATCAVAERKTDASLRYLLAGVLLESGSMREAGNMLRGALFLDQEFVLAHFALGNLAQHQGHLRQRNKSYSTALDLLKQMDAVDEVPESDGLTAGRLREIIQTIMGAAG